jgi:hypothetical protein
MSTPETEPPKATDERPIRDASSGKFVKGHPKLGSGKRIGSKHKTSNELRQEYVNAIERKGDPKAKAAATAFGRGLDRLTVEKLAEYVARVVMPKPRDLDEDKLVANGWVEKITISEINIQSVPEGKFLISNEKIQGWRQRIVELEQLVAERDRTIAILRRGPSEPAPVPSASAIKALTRPSPWPPRDRALSPPRETPPTIDVEVSQPRRRHEPDGWLDQNDPWALKKRGG